MDTDSLNANREFWKYKVDEWQNSKQTASAWFKRQILGKRSEKELPPT
jgi:hypothetical protein